MPDPHEPTRLSLISTSPNSGTDVTPAAPVLLVGLAGAAGGSSLLADAYCEIEEQRERAERAERELRLVTAERDRERAMRESEERRWHDALREAVAAEFPMLRARVEELERELESINPYIRAEARRAGALASITAQVRRTKRENERALLARYGASAPKVIP